MNSKKKLVSSKLTVRATVVVNKAFLWRDSAQNVSTPLHAKEVVLEIIAMTESRVKCVYVCIGMHVCVM